ncbi:MAG: hypothetical protein RQ875_02230 [Vicingaceae bacterium]|nr:hypothetical protein [Vicingaceae bacterium]
MKKQLFIFSLLCCFFIKAGFAQELPQNFYGKYVSNICNECFWDFTSDDTGVWQTGFGNEIERVPFIWEVMIDSNGDLQLAKEGNNTGYVIKITYMMVPLSEKVKGILISSQKDNPQAMGIFWFNDESINFQFMAKTNAFYSKK